MKKRSSIYILKRFLDPIKERKKEYFKQGLQAFLVWINGVIHVFFLERIIHFLENSNREYFYIVLQVYVGYIILFEVVNFSIRKWWWMNTLPYTIADLFREYLNTYIRLDNNKIELIGTGKMIGIVGEWCRAWSVLLTNVVEKWVNLTTAICFTLYMIGRVDFTYSIVFIGLLFVFFLVIIWANAQLFPFRWRRYEYRNIRLKQFVKVLMNKTEILQTGKIDSEIEDIYRNTKDVSQISIDMAPYRVLMKRTAPLGITLLLLFCFEFFGTKVLNGELNLSLLVWLSGTLIIMQKTISDTISFYVESSKEFIKIHKLWDFFDSTSQIHGYDTWKKFIYKNGAISLKDLSYGYDSSNPVFTDLSLDILGSKITALVWPSGGGKSTLVKLIAGYVRQDSGDIFIDHQNLKETSLKSYYADIGYLTQEPSVFDGTVKENLLYAVKKDPTKKELEETISQAHCEFIYDLPNGLDTEIGERGVKLSGWQKQRLAIAKIFLKNPKIIILDEPTSALDSHSEQKITEAMHNLFKWRMVIIIAHRLQTVKHADDIIVIDSGKVIERGTHSSLIKKNGYYKEMLDLQSGF